MKKRFRRLLPIFCALVVLVSCLAVPAFAKDFDYHDYVIDQTSDGTTDLITLKIPASEFTNPLWWFRKPDWTVISQSSSSSFKFTTSADAKYLLEFRPFGSRDKMDMRDIPSGTKVYFEMSITPSANYTTPRHRWTIVWYDKDGNQISSQYTDMEAAAIGDPACSITLVKPDSAVYADFRVMYYDFQNLVESGSQTYTFTFKSLRLELSIASMLLLQQETGRTNKLLESIQDEMGDVSGKLDGVNDSLDDVNDKLDGVDDKLDDIINGTVPPQSPDGSDIIDDIGKAEDDILGTVEDGFKQGEATIAEAITSLFQFASAFAALTWIFNLFANIPFFSSLLYISFALGIFSALLGIVHDYVGARVSGESRREQGRMKREINKKRGSRRG